MIKTFFEYLFNKIKKCSITKKILLIFTLFIYIFIFCISVIKVDYVVMTPGVVNDASVTVTFDNKDRGIIGTIGIYDYIQPSVLQYWIAKLDNKMEITEYNPETDLNEEEDYVYGVVSKKVSIVYSLIVAYDAAKEYDDSINLVKSFNGMIVSSITNGATTAIKAQDIITEVSGEKFIDTESFKALIKKHYKENDLSFTVIRNTNGEDYEIKGVTAELISQDGNNYIPFTFFEYWTVDGEKSNPSFTINEDYTSIGGSGGAMTTLSIYNALTNTDITDVIESGNTKSLKIAGTGTINLDGSIGTIGGVKQKVLTAYLKGMDVFFVDEGDYDDAVSALDLYDINETDLKIISVSSFNDIIESLKKWGE